MAKIYLKGVGVREVSYNTAKKIDDGLNNNTISGNDLVKLDGMTCRAGQIQAVILEPDRVYSTDAEELDKSYSKDRREILQQTPKQRAERIEFFKLFYFMFYKKEPGEIEINQAKELQEKFYTENSNRLHPDPRIFKDMMADKKALKMGWNIIERIIDTDLAYEKNDRKYLASLDENKDYPRENKLVSMNEEMEF